MMKSVGRVHHASRADALVQTSLINQKSLMEIKNFLERGARERGLTN